MSAIKKENIMLNWLPEEEQHLLFLRNQMGLFSWKQIAESLNAMFPRRIRTGTQCRDRYVNYLKFGQPKQRKKEWSRGEELCIMRHYLTDGPQWKKIAVKMDGRSENCVKNKFHSTMRAYMRQINAEVHSERAIAYDELNRILNFLPLETEDTQQYSCILEHRELILREAFKSQKGDEDPDRDEFCRKIHKYSQKVKGLCLNESCESKLKNKNKFLFWKPVREEDLPISRVRRTIKQKIEKKEAPKILSASQNFALLQQQWFLECKIVQLFADIHMQSSLRLLNFLPPAYLPQNLLIEYQEQKSHSNEFSTEKNSNNRKCQQLSIQNQVPSFPVDA